MTGSWVVVRRMRNQPKSAPAAASTRRVSPFAPRKGVLSRSERRQWQDCRGEDVIYRWTAPGWRASAVASS